jgi:tetratricopeptide (TPR) repeat protein
MVKKIMVWIGLIFILISLTFAELNWTTDYKNSILEARKRDKFLLLFFTSTTQNVNTVKKMESATLSHKDTLPYLSPFILIRLDVGQELELVNKYQVTTFPTVIFTKPSGTELNRVTGYLSAKKFQKNVSDIAGMNLTYGSSDTLIKQLRARPKDVSVLYSFGVEQMNIRDYNYAERVFRQILELDAADEFGYGEVTRLNLAYCLMQGESSKEKIGSAINVLEELLQKYPQTDYKGEISFLLGFNYNALGNKEKAIQIYQTALPITQEPWLTKIYKQLDLLRNK